MLIRLKKKKKKTPENSSVLKLYLRLIQSADTGDLSQTLNKHLLTEFLTFLTITHFEICLCRASTVQVCLEAVTIETITY